MSHRIISCDLSELHFASEPRLSQLILDVASGREWWWDHNGLIGILTVPILHNALITYKSYKENRHQREPVPEHVGKFVWGQTISAAEQAEQFRQADAANSPGSSDPH